ncbi:hypothetical protein [Streptomyces lunaelactis]|nr:hypothetical protein [Streptomyces lunaelactis]
MVVSSALAAAPVPSVGASPPASAGTSATATAGPRAALDALNYSPTSRTLKPTAVHTTSGIVENPQNVLSGQPTRISGSQSAITLDFGKEVGGPTTL